MAIPAQGMIEFRDALTDLLDEFSADEHGYKPELPEGRHMHVDNKNFYFDIGQNNRGIYMRISEVSCERYLDLRVVWRLGRWVFRFDFFLHGRRTGGERFGARGDTCPPLEC